MLPHWGCLLAGVGTVRVALTALFCSIETIAAADRRGIALMWGRDGANARTHAAELREPRMFFLRRDGTN